MKAKYQALRPLTSLLLELLKKSTLDSRRCKAFLNVIGIVCSVPIYYAVVLHFTNITCKLSKEEDLLTN